ncbi:hypothetical protein GCM10009863_19640 [Streptomyces axinellae]|uniref:Transposase n=1 Tax=Streptomyces axinellae TaxID=552788 RepID=A0ABN3PYI8_9ACTN
MDCFLRVHARLLSQRLDKVRGDALHSDSLHLDPVGQEHGAGLCAPPALPLGGASREDGPVMHPSAAQYAKKPRSHSA